jgi:outer membrane murein-binding lipoprotein Lpp
MGPSLGGRASRGLARFLIIFSIGIGATLAWQSYGDAARAMLANSSPQLGWLAPQTAPLAQTTPSMVVPPAADTASSDLQQLMAAVASMRQSVDQLAAQLAAGQQQVADNIAKLHADEQKILQKLSATPQKLSGTPPGATAAPARKPSPGTAPPSPSASPSASAQPR